MQNSQKNVNSEIIKYMVFHILDKAVKFLTAKLPITQGDRHHFLLDKVGLTETEYLECLNIATNGGVVREAFK